MEAMGMLGLAKLAHATKNDSYFAMSERPLSYTLAETTLFQADHARIVILSRIACCLSR